jgi:hypothetical protein
MARLKSKTPASQRETGVRSVATREAEQQSDGAGMIAGNALDVGTGNAQVVQLTVVEGIQFPDGLLISGPLLESLANVHFSLLFSHDAYVVGRALLEQWAFGQATYA